MAMGMAMGMALAMAIAMAGKVGQCSRDRDASARASLAGHALSKATGRSVGW